MIRVAAYCRVSTDLEDQANSFDAQQRYFRDMIASRADWELYAIYADEGITGTTTKRRIQFNRMIQDAYDGQFQLILTKEVSRFSRNILDTISFTRELKSHGVAVLFLTDNINTLDKDAELYLSILASLAQEESRRTSSRVTWGQTRQMEKGVVFGRSLLGYEVKDGKISIDPKEAETVKLIFQKYAVEQMGTTAIARYLQQEKYETHTGNTSWTPNAIVKILKNEKYVGDLIQKKTFTPDFLSHKKQRNRGEVPLVCIKNHHEAIVSREVWEQVQSRINRNKNQRTGKNAYSNRYLFSGRIRCGECGAVFISRTKKNADGSPMRRWSCSTAVRRGVTACSIGRLVRDDDAKHMLKIAVTNLSLDTASILKNISMLVFDTVQESDRNSFDDPIRFRSELKRIKKKKEAALDCYFAGELSRTDMQAMKEMYEKQIESLEQRIQVHQERKEGIADYQTIYSTVESVLKCETESEIFYKCILDKLVVYKNCRITLMLRSLPHQFLFE